MIYEWKYRNRRWGKRLNRKLDKDYQRICKTRGAKAVLEFGTYHLLDTYRNLIVDSFLDLEEYGREYEVLHELEKVAA